MKGCSSSSRYCTIELLHFIWVDEHLVTDVGYCSLGWSNYAVQRAHNIWWGRLHPISLHVSSGYILAAVKYCYAWEDYHDIHINVKLSYAGPWEDFRWVKQHYLKTVISDGIPLRMQNDFFFFTCAYVIPRTVFCESTYIVILHHILLLPPKKYKNWALDVNHLTVVDAVSAPVT